MNNINFQKYPAYKYSGVEWLGEIPEHWEIGKLGTLLKPISEKNHPDLPLLSITREAGVIERNIEDDSENHNYIPDDLSGYKLLKEGQFGMNKMKAWQGSYGIAPLTGIVSPAYYIFDLNSSINPRFFHLAIRSKNYVAFFGQASEGVRVGQWDLSKTRMREIPFFIPPLSEQTAIATFLDTKTAQIDRAITQKERMIDLLKERKQIIIQDLVTGKKVWNEKQNAWVDSRSSSEVEMKDSGVEWIGEIPEGWEVKKLFGICRFVRGNSTFSKDELLSNGEYVALQYGKTYKVAEVNDNYQFYVNSEFYKDSQVVNYGDTIIISTSETIQDLGHSAYYNRNDLGLLGGEQMMMKPNMDAVNGLFLYYTSKVFSKELRKYATGIKVYRFNINDLKTVHFAVPSIQVQSTIVTHIEAQSTKINKAIDLQEQQIEKLKELKATLIDSAVTGKIKVALLN